MVSTVRHDQQFSPGIPGFSGEGDSGGNGGARPAGRASADTLCVGGGAAAGDGDPLVVPIVQSTSFRRAGLESTAEHAYSRVSNPTVAALEQVLGRLEDAPPAVCFSTGLAAETALFLSLLRAGDHVVCGRAVYGGTTRLLQRILAELGIASDFVDASDPQAVRAALTPRTKLVFIESPSNPVLELTDIAAVAAVAHAGGALLAVDNTFLTAVLQRPLDLGADLSVYSTTKFIEGHSAALGGAVVARSSELLDRLRFLRKCTGAIQTPFNAWLTLQGVKTLPLRLRQQSATAARLAAWLAESAQVARVHYPALGAAAQRALAERQHLGAHGAVVSFELVGGLPA
ncbi:MAG TPA: aminotransferase class I/II-fold pyridoxal phosphate-dependent enzyme, partial [Planctomycetota bacterium]|nr:aminotransferase class I/II-fold pyridoxal phosphate-dependent enzyme [Planctomycetota bacterium]